MNKHIYLLISGLITFIVAHQLISTQITATDSGSEMIVNLGYILAAIIFIYIIIQIIGNKMDED